MTDDESVDSVVGLLSGGFLVEEGADEGFEVLSRSFMRA